MFDHIVVVNGIPTEASDLGTTAEGSRVTPGLSPTTKEDLPLCHREPPRLIGPRAAYMDGPDFEYIAKDNVGLRPGGMFSPSGCKARHRVAIVIPYRNRMKHLRVLLHNLHPILGRQQLEYGIYVIDQALPGRFNRAMLMNIGFVEAMKRHDYQCFVFHDVDLIPEDDRNIYSCPQQPRHMSVAIDKYDYLLDYKAYFGGVSALSASHFSLINGCSNLYFGWGGEDDDMRQRILAKGLNVTRYPMEIARYKMIKHTRDKHNEKNDERSTLLSNATQRMSYDGINTLVYTVNQVDKLPTHTRIEVLIDEHEVMKNYKQTI